MCKLLHTVFSNQSGETLAETLVSLLVAGLSIVMLSTAVAAASRIVLRTRTVSESYRTVTNDLVDGGAGDNVTITVSDNVFGATRSKSIEAQATTPSALPGSKTVVTYEVP